MAARRARRVRANPSLVIFGGNPPRGWQKIARDVQAILYVHSQDGKCYVHGFANHDPSQEELRSGMLDMGALPTRTGVEAYWSPDKTQVLLQSRNGKKIIGLF